MTLNGAITELVMMRENPMMPAVFKSSLDKVIETVSECEEPERKTGKWILDTEQYEAVTCVCSECGSIMTTPKHDRAKYCWNCGADMRGEWE